MKLEEQKSDLERQLKTLTKQIKVRRGYCRGQGAFSIIVLRVSPPSVWNPLKNTPLTLLACFLSTFPWALEPQISVGRKQNQSSFSASG